MLGRDSLSEAKKSWQKIGFSDLATVRFAILAKQPYAI
jgi:hypothetical protein